MPALKASLGSKLKARYPSRSSESTSAERADPPTTYASYWKMKSAKPENLPAIGTYVKLKAAPHWYSVRGTATRAARRVSKLKALSLLKRLVIRAVYADGEHLRDPVVQPDAGPRMGHELIVQGQRPVGLQLEAAHAQGQTPAPRRRLLLDVARSFLVEVDLRTRLGIDLADPFEVAGLLCFRGGFAFVGALFAFGAGLAFSRCRFAFGSSSGFTSRCAFRGAAGSFTSRCGICSRCWLFLGAGRRRRLPLPLAMREWVEADRCSDQKRNADLLHTSSAFPWGRPTPAHTV